MLNAVSISFHTKMVADDGKALRTGRADFLATARKLADVFVSLLPESGVPWWYVFTSASCLVSHH